MTRDYVNSNKAYLERMKQLRQREKEHLSAVDFSLFVKRFDRLISKIEAELRIAEAWEGSHSTCILLSCAPGAGGSVVLGTYLSAFSYNMTLTHCANTPVSSINEPRTLPREVSSNTISIRNDETTINFPNCFAPAMPV